MSQYRCPECGYTYDEDIGDDYEGFAPGTSFANLPAEFACPDCSVRDKDDFEKVS
jgi:rubredoxin